MQLHSSPTTGFHSGSGRNNTLSSSATDLALHPHRLIAFPQMGVPRVINNVNPSALHGGRSDSVLSLRSGFQSLPQSYTPPIILPGPTCVMPQMFQHSQTPATFPPSSESLAWTTFFPSLPHHVDTSFARQPLDFSDGWLSPTSTGQTIPTLFSPTSAHSTLSEAPQSSPTSSSFSVSSPQLSISTALASTEVSPPLAGSFHNPNGSVDSFSAGSAVSRPIPITPPYNAASFVDHHPCIQPGFIETSQPYNSLLDTTFRAGISQRGNVPVQNPQLYTDSYFDSPELVHTKLRDNSAAHTSRDLGNRQEPLLPLASTHSLCPQGWSSEHPISTLPGLSVSRGPFVRHSAYPSPPVCGVSVCSATDSPCDDSITPGNPESDTEDKIDKNDEDFIPGSRPKPRTRPTKWKLKKSPRLRVAKRSYVRHEQEVAPFTLGQFLRLYPDVAARYPLFYNSLLPSMTVNSAMVPKIGSIPSNVGAVGKCKALQAMYHRGRRVLAQLDAFNTRFDPKHAGPDAMAPLDPKIQRTIRNVRRKIVERCENYKYTRIKILNEQFGKGKYEPIEDGLVLWHPQDVDTDPAGDLSVLQSGTSVSSASPFAGSGSGPAWVVANMRVVHPIPPSPVLNPEISAHQSLQVDEAQECPGLVGHTTDTAFNIRKMSENLNRTARNKGKSRSAAHLRA